MVFCLCDVDGLYFIFGIWIDINGIIILLGNGEIDFVLFVFYEVEGRILFVLWKLSLFFWNVDVIVELLNVDFWMFVMILYWEGLIIFDGENMGYGYFEMMGY